ncbi:MAG TPA: CDP-alcohol phosphatidyltransferase family protein [Gemmatimonadaceae bacterium]|jgi:CDP-diacylglycerol---glycerol-3-phosphate 3-phosphatidyltransferase|nr:CDP-alcohol phosphatidyltransferase family protein [Gemmatimonadaceae bacterium]
MNLPNALTVARIAVTPLIAILPFANSWELRLLAFILFTLAGLTDYVDGMLARSRKEVTDLGKLLDPLADKLLLLGTLIPMYLLASRFPFRTPFGDVGLPWWILVVVLGREAFMTLFRQAAAKRGVVIAAIGPAKWKTGFQLVWQGSAYFWFFAATLAASRRWTNDVWQGFALFNGSVGTLMMIVAVVLTVYSFALYLRSFGSVFAASPSK